MQSMKSPLFRLSYLEEELALVCLITFLLVLLSLPLLFGNHTHQEPACYCNAKEETSDTSEDDAEDGDAKEKNSYKLLKKKKKAKSSSSEDEDAKEKNAYKLLKKKKSTEKKLKKEEEQQVKVKLELEPEEDGKVDFNLDVEVDPDTPGKEPLTTHLEGQVHYWLL